MNKFDSYILRFQGAFSIVLAIWVLNGISGNAKMIQHLEDTKADKINVVTLASYIAIEQGRTEVVSELFVDFGRMIRVKEDELDPFRIIAARKLNRSIRSGTTRGGN